MQYSIRYEKGFTLIEIIIALAIFAVLSAMVIPNMVNFVQKGEKAAFQMDLMNIQLAVDSYYVDPANRGKGTGLTGSLVTNKGKKLYPLKGTENERVTGGTPIGTGAEWTTGSGFIINMDILVSDKYLTLPSSVSLDNSILGTGSYSWYVKTDGKVEAKWIGDRTAINYQEGAYP